MKERPILFSGPMVSAILDGRKTQTRRIVKPQPEPFGKSSYGGTRQGWKWKPETFNRGWNDDDKNLYAAPSSVMATWAIGLSCPYGQPGDRLWVKETHRHPSKDNPRVRVDYRADMSSWGIADSHDLTTNEVTRDAKLFPGRANDFSKQHWRPSIFMPRWASRITLVVIAVRVERLQDISKDDSKAEGIERIRCGEHETWKNYQFKTAHPRRRVSVTDLRYRLLGYESPCASYMSLWESINGPGSWQANPWVWVIQFLRVS